MASLILCLPILFTVFNPWSQEKKEVNKVPVHIYHKSVISLEPPVPCLQFSVLQNMDRVALHILTLPNAVAATSGRYDNINNNSNANSN